MAVATRSDGGRYPISVVDFDVVHARHVIHPTQKPVPLLEYLIFTYSNPGDLVLDPTAGALTTAVAAHRTGRRSVCIELSEEYLSLGMARLADEWAETSAPIHIAAPERTQLALF